MPPSCAPSRLTTPRWIPVTGSPSTRSATTPVATSRCRTRRKKATYRQILERRAEQNGIDFVNGITTALTPMAFFEIVMLKAFESLIDPDTTVDVAAGMIAAGRLQALLPARDGGSDLARLKAQVAQIGEAVRATVPQPMWADIVAKLDELEPRSRDITDGDDLDEACEPDDFDEF